MSKIALSPNASGTGVFTIASPNGNTDRTLTLPDEAGTVLTTAGVPASAMPAGSVIQVVQGVLSTGFSTTSGSDQDTGLNATITPQSSSNKILVIVSTMLRAYNGGGGNCYIYQKLWRGAVPSGTVLWEGYPIVGSQNTDVRGVGNMTYLDSPNTTSATAYRVSINSAYASEVFINSTTSPSTITLMEIAA